MATSGQGTGKFFGLKQHTPPSGFPQPVFNDDYEQKYPEDPYCEEAAPNARVWRVYNEEAATFDETMVGQSRDGLDVMLVFAGLFSAVVTSFLVQASQNLQPDFAEMSATLLHDVVLLQLAITTGASVPNITAPSINPSQKFAPDTIDVWINGLWVVSLTASLAVALAAVLIKQWLHHYVSLPSGTPLLRSHIRHFRFMGLELWRVRVIIGILPFVMHVSLILFLSGLVLFFIPLRVSLAWTVGTITTLVFALYLVSIVMPIIHPQCPYQTPLNDLIHYAFSGAFAFLRSTVLQHLRVQKPTERSWFDPLPPITSSPPPVLKLKSLTTLEREIVESRYDLLSINALDWLFKVSSNPSVRSIVVQALGGLPTSMWDSLGDAWSANFFETQMMCQPLMEDSRAPQISHYSERRLERIVRLPLFQEMYPYRLWGPDRCLRNVTDPRLKAVLWIATEQPDVPWDASMHLAFRDFLLTHHETRLHQWVWIQLVQLAVAHDVFRLNDRTLDVVRLLTLVFPYDPLSDDILAPNQEMMGTLPPPVTLRTAVTTHPPLVTWDLLAEIPLLSSFNEPDNPFFNEVDNLFPSEHRSVACASERRFVSSAGRFALHHVVDYSESRRETSSSADDESQLHYLELLERVLERMAHRSYSYMLYRHEDHLDIGIFPDFIHAVIESYVCTRALPDSMDPRMRQCLNECIRHLVDLYYWFVSSMPVTIFPFPLLHRILPVAVNRMVVSPPEASWLRPTSHVLSHPPTTFQYTSRKICDIMRVSLARGSEEAFRIFAHDSWMELMSPLWLWNPTPNPVEIVAAYISGLGALESDAARHEFLDYLFQPRILILACIAVSSRAETTTALIRLQPSHPSWSECQSAIQSLLGWAQHPSAVFPLQDLYSAAGQLFEGSAVDLEKLRRMFREDANVEALRILNDMLAGAARNPEAAVLPPASHPS